VLKTSILRADIECTVRGGGPLGLGGWAAVSSEGLIFFFKRQRKKGREKRGKRRGGKKVQDEGRG